MLTQPARIVVLQQTNKKIRILLDDCIAEKIMFISYDLPM